VDPYQVAQLKMELFLILVGFLHGLGIGPFNPLPDLCMEVFYLLSSILSLLTTFVGKKEWERDLKGS